ncbi:MAG: hypothetical protein CSB55_08085 [Candidatus Cloacimonadota bacterium]|nr:MAG: hypothetical protein CSB55_08085 [Candidatus Cloacimonadota bacterium]
MKRIRSLIFCIMLIFFSSGLFAYPFTLHLKDSYGDGWNGGKITLSVNGSQKLDVTLDDGSEVSYAFEAENGNIIATDYTAGENPHENSYEIKNPLGEVILVSGNVNTSAPSDEEITVDFTPDHYVEVEEVESLDQLVGLDAKYQITIRNSGTENDTYNLSLSGNTWIAGIFVSGTTNPLSSIQINAGESVEADIRVTVPEDAEQYETDSLVFTATLSTDSSVNSSINVITRALTPEPLPLSEGFEEWFPAKWEKECSSPAYFKQGNESYDGEKSAMQNNLSYYSMTNSLISPFFKADADSLILSFYWMNNRDNTNSNGKNELIIYTSDDGEIWEQKDMICACLSNGWKRYSKVISSDAVKIKISVKKYYGSSQYHTYIDNFTLVNYENYDYSAEIAGVGEDSQKTGRSIRHCVTLYNTGTETDSYSLTVSDNSWNIAVYEHDTDIPVSQVELSPLQTAVFDVAVSVPANVAGGAMDSLVFSANSQNDSSVHPSLTVKTIANSSEDFSYGIPPSWTVIDQNEDGRMFYSDYSGEQHYASISGTNNDWLITPRLQISQARHLLNFKAGRIQGSYSIDFEVMVSETGKDHDDFVALSDHVYNHYNINGLNENSMHTVDLSDYEGEYIYVAFHVTRCSGYIKFAIDDVEYPQLAVPQNSILASYPDISGFNFRTKDLDDLNIESKNLFFGNAGLDDLVLNQSDIALSGDDANQFTLEFPEETSFPLTLKYNETLTCTVKFTPDTIGNKNAALTATNNSSGNVLSFNLSGKSTPSKPVIVAPEDKAVNVPLDRILTWTNSPGTDFITLYLDTLYYPEKILDKVPVRDSYDPDLKLGKRYYWRVYTYSYIDGQEHVRNSPLFCFDTVLPEDVIQAGYGEWTSSYSPFYVYADYSYCQSIYLQDEINISDKRIDRIMYYCKNSSQDFTDEIDIYMGHTEKTGFDSNNDWIPVNDLIHVYSGNYQLKREENWYEIILDAPFIYNGTDNLVIAVDENKPGRNSGIFNSLQGSQYRSLSVLSGVSDIDPENAENGNGYRSNRYANLRIKFSDIPDNPVFNIMPDISEKQFDIHELDSEPEYQTFMIKNSGDGNITVNESDIALSGDDADQFTLLFPEGTSFPVQLSGNDNLTFSVGFDPSSAGNKTAALTIEDNLAERKNSLARSYRTDYANRKLSDGRNLYTVNLIGTAIAGKPTNLLPENEKLNIPLNQVLSWTNGNGTESVTLYFDTVNPPVAKLLDGASPQESYSPEIQNGQRYYWKVVNHVNIEGTDYSSSSEIRFFETLIDENIIQTGIGNEVKGYPFYSYNSYTQSIYMQSEINVENRQIEKISYQYNGYYSYPVNQFITVYMGHTEKTEFDSRYDWISIDSLTMVYTGNVTIPAEEGWIEIDLDVPFEYNNTDNLVIAVKKNYSSPSLSWVFYNFETDENRSLVYGSYNEPDPANPPGGSLQSFVPNIRFETGDIAQESILTLIPNITDKQFEEQTLDQTPQQQNFIIRNTGSGSLEINEEDIELSGDDHDQFSLVFDENQTFPVYLSGEEELAFIVKFTPNSLGSKAALLTVRDTTERTLRRSRADLYKKAYKSRTDRTVTLSGKANFAAPVLLNPANNANDVPLDQTLSWTIGTGTDSVALYLDKVNPPQMQIPNISPEQESYDAQLQGGKKYHWKAVAYAEVDGVLEEKSTSLQSFNTALPENMLAIGNMVYLNRHLPMEPSSKYSYTQSIYLQSELDIQDKKIEKIQYRYNKQTPPVDDIVIYMGHTAKNEFSSKTDWISLNTLTQVYSGNFSGEESGGWFEIELDDPFIYNNTDNLVIAFKDNDDNQDQYNNDFYCSYVSNYRSLYVYDSENPDPQNPPEAISLARYIPNIRIGYNDLDNVSPSVDFGDLHVYFNEDESSDSLDLASYITDPDTDFSDLIITYGGNNNISVNIDDPHNVYFSANPNWTGTEHIVFTASDGDRTDKSFRNKRNISRGSASASLPVTVLRVNDPPIIDFNGLHITLNEDQTSEIYNFADYIEDIDNANNELELTASGNSEINVNISGLEAVFSATENWNGTETITFTVSDGISSARNSRRTTRAESSAELDVTFLPVNDPPSINFEGLNVNFPENSISEVYDFSEFISDPEENDLTLTAENSEHITATVEGMTVVFSATENWTGTETLTFTVNDNVERIRNQRNLLRAESSASLDVRVGDSGYSQGELVITEVISNGNASYVELFNNTNEILSLADVKIQYFDNGSSENSELSLTGNLSAGEYYLIAENQVAFASAYPGKIADIQFIEMTLDGGKDAIKLLHNDQIADRFNKAGGEASSWENNTVFVRTDFLTSGESLENDWENTDVEATPGDKNSIDTETRSNWIPYTDFDFGSNGNGEPAVVLNIHEGSLPGETSITVRRGKLTPHQGEDTFVKRYIEIDSQNYPGDASMTIYYKDSELNGLDENKLIIVGYWDGEWHEFSDVMRDPELNMIRANGINHFSQWTLREKKDNSLPVEFTAFSLMQVENEVMVKWITQSENDLRGFYVLKSETDALADADKISALIPASNTVSAQEYIYADKEVAPNKRYWYWAEAISFDDNHSLTQSQSIMLGELIEPEEDIPGIEYETGITDIYPNPFNPPVNISFFIDEETAEQNSSSEITIFNLKGQEVHRRDLGINLTPGMYTIIWNGNDKDGKECGSGIYFVKFRTGSHQSIKKSIKLK